MRLVLRFWLELGFGMGFGFRLVFCLGFRFRVKWYWVGVMVCVRAWVVDGAGVFVVAEVRFRVELD